MKRLLALMILIAGCSVQPAHTDGSSASTATEQTVRIGDATVTLTDDPAMLTGGGLGGTTNCNPLVTGDSAKGDPATESQTRNLMEIFSPRGHTTNFCGWYCRGETYCCDTSDGAGRCCCFNPTTCACNF